MRLGYACINMSIAARFGTCRKNKVEEQGIQVVRNLLLRNFRVVLRILEWNNNYDMALYRLSSDLVPFGSHPMLDGWDWWNDPEVIQIAERCRQVAWLNNHRITIHPGQYNNLSSPNKDVVTSTFRDLVHQARMLEMFGGSDMIIHLGGVYGDKKSAKQRFITHYKELPQSIKNYLRIENDDKSYHIADAMEVCDILGSFPMYDYHHDICYPSQSVEETREGLLKLWRGHRIKVHLSSGRTRENDFRHSDYITSHTWSRFHRDFGDLDLDVMLEAKGKNLAVFDLREKIAMMGLSYSSEV